MLAYFSKVALGVDCKCLVKVASSLYSTTATIAYQCIKQFYRMSIE